MSSLSRRDRAAFKVGSEPLTSELPTAPSRGSLTLFRYCVDESPFWVLPNGRAGRWNNAGEQPTQYWSATPDAAWAELIRREGLEAEADPDLVRMPIWACRAPVAGLIDLRNAWAREAAGITEAELVSDDWSPCQRLSAALRGSCSGVIAPSPVLDGHANVTMFGPRRMIDWRGRTALPSSIPACIASVGRPRPGLLDEVRV